MKGFRRKILYVRFLIKQSVVLFVASSLISHKISSSSYHHLNTVVQKFAVLPDQIVICTMNETIAGFIFH